MPSTHALVTHVQDHAWERIDAAPNPDAMRWKTLAGGEGANTKNITFGIMELAPGAQLRPHHHAEDEVYYITQGSGTVLLDDTLVEVTAGSSIFIPGDLVHGVRNTGDTTLHLLWIFPTDSWEEVEYHMVDRDV